MALLMVTFLSLPSWGADGPTVKGSVIKMEKLDMNQLKTLPDAAVIEIKGKQTTKKQIMDNIEAVRQRAMADMKAKSAKAKADFEAKRSAHLQAQKAQVAAGNAKVKPELARLKANAQQYARVRAEAAQLHAKYASATPAEQAKLDNRAGELTAELKKLGY